MPPVDTATCKVCQVTAREAVAFIDEYAQAPILMPLCRECMEKVTALLTSMRMAFVDKQKLNLVTANTLTTEDLTMLKEAGMVYDKKAKAKTK